MSTRPSVLLIGWTGHHPKQLQKYAGLYDTLGFDSISFSEHSSHLIGTSKNTEERHGTTVLKIIEEKKPVSVHMFSNGGTFVWATALRLALDRAPAGSNPFPSVQSVVIDSAPGCLYLSDIPSLHYFVWAMLGKSIGKKAGWLLLALPATVLFVLLYFICLQWLPSHNITTTYWSSLLRGARVLGCPHLLLHSTDDGLIPFQHVRRLGKSLESIEGVTVKRKEWPKSGHVAHLKFHPEEYRELIAESLPK